MHAYIILCLIAVAYAEKLGYNYQPVDHSDIGLSFNPSSASNVAPQGSAILSQPIGSSLGSGIPSSQIGALHGSAVLSQPIVPSAAPSYSVPASEFNKEFFSYSAPESEFEDADANRLIANSVKQGLRVIFIKGPENKALENAALSLAKQASEQQTAIYVLSKQADIGELADKLNVIRNNNNAKPDVHFVKYRTPEDAANAQRQIQSQYDSLQGTSQSHNGGVAPVINFASKGQIQTAAAPQAPGSSYLPASIFRRRT